MAFPRKLLSFRRAIFASRLVGLSLLMLSAAAFLVYLADWKQPVGVGSTWVYQVSWPSGVIYVETQKLRALEFCGFRICGVYASSSTFGGSIQWRTSDWLLIQTVALDPNGNSRRLTYDSALLLYRLPFSVGDNWDWETGGTRVTTVRVPNGGTLAKQERVTISGTHREVTNTTHVSVPAGKFLCYVVDQYDENNIISQRVWFSEEVGEAVKYVGGFFSVFQTRWELLNYTLATRSPGEFLSLDLGGVRIPTLIIAGIILSTIHLPLKLRKAFRGPEPRTVL